ncbi:Transcriptional regulator, MarR family [Actinomycetales bacterium JB111]|nr:Transcriptional regulator, MarR family [Actinomycetales bacterium JB111]
MTTVPTTSATLGAGRAEHTEPGEIHDPPRLLYLVKEVELVSRALLAEVLKDSGVTVLQYTALTVLDRTPRMTSSGLARKSFVTAQTMSEIIAALHRQGLVRRERDPDNRRQFLVELTEAGADLLQRYDPALDDLERTMVRRLSPQQTAQLRTFLDACRSDLVRLHADVDLPDET